MVSDLILLTQVEFSCVPQQSYGGIHSMGQTLPAAAAQQCRISWKVVNFGQTVISKHHCHSTEKWIVSEV